MSTTPTLFPDSAFDEPSEPTRFERFLRFYEKHRDVYERFRQKALEARRRGYRRIGARFLVELIRWETPLESDDPREPFKVNDHVIPYLARLLMAREPHLFDGLFAVKDGRFETPADEIVAACDRIDARRRVSLSR